MVRYKFQVKDMPLTHSGVDRVLNKHNMRDGAKENEKIIIKTSDRARCVATVWGHEEAECVIKMDAGLRSKLALDTGDEVYLAIQRVTFWGRLRWYGSMVLWFFETLIGIIGLSRS